MPSPVQDRSPRQHPVKRFRFKVTLSVAPARHNLPNFVGGFVVHLLYIAQAKPPDYTRSVRANESKKPRTAYDSHRYMPCWSYSRNVFCEGGQLISTNDHPALLHEQECRINRPVSGWLEQGSSRPKPKECRTRHTTSCGRRTRHAQGVDSASIPFTLRLTFEYQNKKNNATSTVFLHARAHINSTQRPPFRRLPHLQSVQRQHPFWHFIHRVFVELRFSQGEGVFQPERTERIAILRVLPEIRLVRILELR